eukprot:gene11599-biopygen7236
MLATCYSSRLVPLASASYMLFVAPGAAGAAAAATTATAATTTGVLGTD